MGERNETNEGERNERERERERERDETMKVMVFGCEDKVVF